MYITKNFEQEVIEKPYTEGYRTLRVLSGYVSPNFVESILDKYDELVLEVIVGMTSNDGISKWNHEQFKKISRNYVGRANISYQIEKPGNHRKVYWWAEDQHLENKIFIGSANFTVNGFTRQGEILVEVTESNIDDVFEDLSTILCTEPQVEQKIDLFEATVHTYHLINDNEEVVAKPVLQLGEKEYSSYVELALTGRGGEVQSRAGLNWGQREGRNANQAYLSVPKEIHNINPTFFPELKEVFQVITDDNQILTCVMAQANRKAIQTKDNSEMGRYFRKRLGLKSGEMIVKENLEQYGRKSIRIFKLEENIFFMDFSK